MVEAPITAQRNRPARRLIASVAVFLLCAGVLTYFLTRSPEPAAGITVAASSPSAWLHADAAVLHRRLRLQSMVEYGGNTAVLQVSGRHGEMLITLRRSADGLWREVDR